MPDSAYLYSAERSDAWDLPEQGCYASRWTIPLAWFFFFRPGDIRLMHITQSSLWWRSPENPPVPGRLEDVGLSWQMDTTQNSPRWRSAKNPSFLGPLEDRELSWQEVRLSAEKAPALEVFRVRRRLLMAAIGGRINDEAVGEFVSKIAERPGHHLIMNPDEVLGGINCDFDDDRGHAIRLAEILEVLSDDSCSAAMAREATLPYVKELPPDEIGCLWQILGGADY